MRTIIGYYFIITVSLQVIKVKKNYKVLQYTKSKLTMNDVVGHRRLAIIGCLGLQEHRERFALIQYMCKCSISPATDSFNVNRIVFGF